METAVVIGVNLAVILLALTLEITAANAANLPLSSRIITGAVRMALVIVIITTLSWLAGKFF